jgi:hypothetical protein
MTGNQGVNPEIMPASVHGEAVVSAFRHLPLLGQVNDTYTVITRDNNPAGEQRYSVFRAWYAPALNCWSIDTHYLVNSGVTWTQATQAFTRRVVSRVS